MVNWTEDRSWLVNGSGSRLVNRSNRYNDNRFGSRFGSWLRSGSWSRFVNGSWSRYIGFSRGRSIRSDSFVFHISDVTTFGSVDGIRNDLYTTVRKIDTVRTGSGIIVTVFLLAENSTSVIILYGIVVVVDWGQDWAEVGGTGWGSNC